MLPTSASISELLSQLDARKHELGVRNVRLLLRDRSSLEAELFFAEPTRVVLLGGGPEGVTEVPSDEIRAVWIPEPYRLRRHVWRACGALISLGVTIGYAFLPWVISNEDLEIGALLGGVVAFVLLAYLPQTARVRGWLTRWRQIYPLVTPNHGL